MSKTMKIVKEHLVSLGIKPTNRNARKELHRWRKLRRMIRAEQKRVDSIITAILQHRGGSRWLR